MRLTICALVLAALAAGPALARDAVPANKQDNAAARTVYVCDNSSMTRRAFTREFGKMEFVTAEAATAKGERWAAPKCVTPAEARRLKQLASLR